MLELIAFSRIRRLHHTVLRPAHDPASRPLLRVFSSLGGKNTDIGGRYFFCSESGDGSDQVVDARVRAAEEEYQSKASAIVSTYPRPKDYLTVSFLLSLLLLLVSQLFQFLLKSVKKSNNSHVSNMSC